MAAWEKIEGADIYAPERVVIRRACYVAVILALALDLLPLMLNPASR